MIGVDVSFWGQRVTPLRFMYEGRRYEIKRVMINFERTDKGKKFLCFGVDTGGAIAELQMDKKDFCWRLASIESLN